MKSALKGLERKVVVWAAVGILIAGTPLFSQSKNEEEFSKLKTLLVEKRLEIESSAKSKKEAFLERYVEALQPVAKAFQTAGDLEGVVAAELEIESASNGALADLGESGPLPGKLQAMREVAEKEVASILESRATVLASLVKKYVGALELLKQSLTKSGELEAAIAVALEIKRVGSMPADPGEVPMPSWEGLPRDIQEGLTAWFSFDDDDDDAEQVKGGSSRALTGTLEGTSYTGDGKIGGARVFDGVNDRITLSDQIPDSERFTIALWIKSEGTPGGGGLFGDFTGKSGNDLMFALSGEQKVHIRADKSGSRFQEVVDLPEPLSKEWHHLAWVSGSNDSTLYLDGKKFARVRGGGSNVGFHGAFIGYSTERGSWTYFHGALDEFMMWDRSLNAEEIQAVYDLAEEK